MVGRHALGTSPWFCVAIASKEPTDRSRDWSLHVGHSSAIVAVTDSPFCVLVICTWTPHREFENMPAAIAKSFHVDQLHRNRCYLHTAAIKLLSRFTTPHAPAKPFWKKNVALYKPADGQWLVWWFTLVKVTHVPPVTSCPGVGAARARIPLPSMTTPRTPIIQDKIERVQVRQ